MCSSIQVFLLFSSCSVGDAILFFTCSFCVFVLVFTTIRKRWTSTTFLHCQRDCFYTEFVGCILLLWSCHSREWFLFFVFLNTCCVDTEKNKWLKTAVSSHLNGMRRVRILCFTGAEWRHTSLRKLDFSNKFISLSLWLFAHMWPFLKMLLQH